MKLAEALVLRADKKKRTSQLQQRILLNARVQEGEEPAENPQSLLDELERLSEELLELIQRINGTNSVSEMEAGFSLSDAIATRDILLLKQGIYRALAQQATVSHDVIRTKSEVRFKASVKVPEIQQRADELPKAIVNWTPGQAMNWKTELL